jgi:glutamate-5-semialdehyde dehydrogenase
MNDLTQTPEMLIATMGARAKRAAAVLAGTPSEAKAAALVAAAAALRAASGETIAAGRCADRGHS